MPSELQPRAYWSTPLPPVHLSPLGNSRLTYAVTWKSGVSKGSPPSACGGSAPAWAAIRPLSLARSVTAPVFSAASDDHVYPLL